MKTRTALVIAVGMAGLGCSASKDLSRGKAKDILEKAFGEGDTVDIGSGVVLGDGTLAPGGWTISQDEVRQLQDKNFYSVATDTLYSSTCCPREVVGSQKV